MNIGLGTLVVCFLYIANEFIDCTSQIYWKYNQTDKFFNPNLIKKKIMFGGLK